jgi:serine-type D-Ala-D-Ala carboxypeptidase/endopeptidase (penicillin-binding protein 4)
MGHRSLAWILGAVLAVTPALGQELNPRIETLIAGAKIGQGVAGVSIVDLESGRVLADIRSDAPFIPASNQKLLTTGAALIVLGPEFVFRTELVSGGERLVIRGSGDPAFADPSILDRMSPKMTVQTLLSALAGAVSKAGVPRVTEIIADDRIFERTLVHEGWPVDQLERWYCAPVSGLNFHTNVVSVFPAPSPDGIGRPPVVEIEPAAPWLAIENKAKTVGQGNNSVWLTRDMQAQRYTMYGQVRFPSRAPVEITVFDPALFMAQLLAAELPRTGVAVGQVGALADGKRLTINQMESVVAAARLAGAEEKLDGRVVAVVSTHMRDILERCNRDSQNLYAEALLKRLGHEVTKEPGSWSNGSSVVRMTISQDSELGPKFAATTVVSDGSGMSREDRVSPRTLTKWLARLQRDPAVGEMFVASLAEPGDGTLRRRFGPPHLSGDLKAKSGSVNGVRCLSGYLTDPETKRRIAFSVMVNDLKEGEQTQALQLHEDVVRAIDKWLVDQRPERAEAAAPNQSVVKKAER